MWSDSYYLNNDNHFSLQRRSGSKAGELRTLKLHRQDLCRELGLVSVSQEGKLAHPAAQEPSGSAGGAQSVLWVLPQQGIAASAAKTALCALKS